MRSEMKWIFKAVVLLAFCGTLYAAPVTVMTSVPTGPKIPLGGPLVWHNNAAIVSTATVDSLAFPGDVVGPGSVNWVKCSGSTVDVTLTIMCSPNTESTDFATANSTTLLVTTPTIKTLGTCGAGFYHLFRITGNAGNGANTVCTVKANWNSVLAALVLK